MPITRKHPTVASPRPQRRRVSRRWCVPPALLRDPATPEAFAGASLLGESAVGDRVALLLWQFVSDVLLWAETPPHRRERLFHRASGVARLKAVNAAAPDPELEVPLHVLTSLIDQPAAARPEMIAKSCLQVARWAAERRAVSTAVWFAQAASVAHPASAAVALEVGRIAAGFGRATRAVTWLQRAVALARRAGDWSAYSRAYTELALLEERRGADESALRHFQKGLRAARRNAVTDVRAAALHGFMRIALRAGRLDDAERHGRDAARAYRRDGSSSPALQIDRARLWVLRGDHGRAAAALQRVVPALSDPGEQMRALALLALAGAGAGDRAVVEDAWMRCWTAADRCPADPGLPAALLDLARACAALGLRSPAERAAARARRAAEALGQHDAADAAGALLEPRRTA